MLIASFCRERWCFPRWEIFTQILTKDHQRIPRPPDRKSRRTERLRGTRGQGQQLVSSVVVDACPDIWIRHSGIFPHQSLYQFFQLFGKRATEWDSSSQRRFPRYYHLQFESLRQYTLRHQTYRGIVWCSSQWVQSRTACRTRWSFIRLLQTAVVPGNDTPGKIDGVHCPQISWKRL